jgi:hypothetical protein
LFAITAAAAAAATTTATAVTSLFLEGRIDIICHSFGILAESIARENKFYRCGCVLVDDGETRLDLIKRFSLLACYQTEIYIAFQSM